MCHVMLACMYVYGRRLQCGRRPCMLMAHAPVARAYAVRMPGSCDMYMCVHASIACTPFVPDSDVCFAHVRSMYHTYIACVACASFDASPSSPLGHVEDDQT